MSDLWKKNLKNPPSLLPFEKFSSFAGKKSSVPTPFENFSSTPGEGVKK